MTASYRFRVTGRVQGVFFRQSTAETAQRLGLDGWVRNCADGSVEGCARGDPAALEDFHRWLHRGPPAARVERVEWTQSDDLPAPGFVVRRE
ncbi:acylphosphatase [Fontimonas thermophila]|uniref:Acylphosphatase n=1 Tax=Fontimonas thermophila TaxID=1076937 RepID=A0A1I2JYE9_9GAMM|nr:acylphosphatase [Fontimonas thermophila]SFF57796.1 acylphosphatase [Fontimonas thermophila]